MTVLMQRWSKELTQTQQLVALIAIQEKPMGEFDERLFDLTVKEIRISKEHDITFCLHNGLELTEKEGGSKMQWHMPIGYKVVNGRITVYEEHWKRFFMIMTTGYQH